MLASQFTLLRVSDVLRHHMHTRITRVAERVALRPSYLIRAYARMSGTGVAISFVHATRRFVRFRRVRNKCSVNAEALNKEKTCDATGEHETRGVECIGLHVRVSFIDSVRG